MPARLNLWKELFRDQEPGKTFIHEYIIIPEAEFRIDTLLARRITKGVYKIVGRCGDKDRYHGIQTHAYGFNANRFSGYTARAWLMKHASGIVKNAVHRKVKFSAGKVNYEIREDAENGTVDILGVEVASVGEANGKFFSDEEIQQVVKDTLEVMDQIRPVFKVEHGEDQPAYGWLTNLRYKAERVLADILSVPMGLWMEIKQGRYARISPELLSDWTDPTTQKSYRYVLSAAAVLGVRLPAMMKLKPLVEFALDRNQRPYAVMQPVEGENSRLIPATYAATNVERVYFDQPDEPIDEIGEHALVEVKHEVEEQPQEGEEDTNMAEDKELKEREKELDGRESDLATDETKLANDKEKFNADRAKHNETIVKQHIKLLVTSGKLAPDEVEKVEAMAIKMAAQDLDLATDYLTEKMAGPDAANVKKAGGEGAPTGDAGNDGEADEISLGEKILHEADALVKEGTAKTREEGMMIAATERQKKNPNFSAEFHKTYFPHIGSRPSDRSGRSTLAPSKGQ